MVSGRTASVASSSDALPSPQVGTSCIHSALESFSPAQHLHHVLLPHGEAEQGMAASQLFWECWGECCFIKVVAWHDVAVLLSKSSNRSISAA